MDWGIIAIALAVGCVSAVVTLLILMADRAEQTEINVHVVFSPPATTSQSDAGYTATAHLREEPAIAPLSAENLETEVYCGPIGEEVHVGGQVGRHRTAAATECRVEEVLDEFSNLQQ
jgi:hypothetical protein